MNMPGFNADGSLYKAPERYTAVTSFEQTERAIQLQQPAPRPGCYFAGTNCYFFVQTLKFCCGDGTEYTQQWGWCFGFWTAPPCRGPAF